MNVRDYKLDILKAIAIILVLIWHLQPIRIVLDSPPALPSYISKYMLGVIYSKTLVAVPIFYFVSLLLFFQKNISSDQYFLQRIKRLSSIFIFWFIVQSIFYLIVKQTMFLLGVPFEPLPHNSKILWILAMGGPALPKVGDSVFYFILNMLFLVIISRYYNKISTIMTDVVFFVILSLYLLVHQFFYEIPYLRIDNFIIYIPLAHFMFNISKDIIFQRKYLYYALSLYFITSIYEIIAPKVLHTMNSAYDVNSLQWGVIVLFIFVNIFSFKENRFVKWLSNYSLGLFAIHKYWFLIFLFIIPSLSCINELTINIGGAIIHCAYILSALLTVCFTFLTIKFFCLFKGLKRFVM